MADDASKTEKITKKGDITQQWHWHLSDELMVYHLFVIFAVLDVPFAVNWCLNQFFYIYIYYVLPN